MSHAWWQQRRSWIGLFIGALIAGLFALRLALPSLVKNYVNRTLDKSEDYDGRTEGERSLKIMKLTLDDL